MNAARVWFFWSELPAGERRAKRRRLRAHPSGPSRRDPAAPATAPQPPRCHIVTVLTATMSHRAGPRAAATPPGPGRLSRR